MTTSAKVLMIAELLKIRIPGLSNLDAIEIAYEVLEVLRNE